ncbi:MAG TPA: MASE1 domain-containing protein [Rhodanobacter sp.]|jgi:glucose-6-phosphate-specific signal transduction histidine kinase|nr:MASE1 domain-containing protein [Rhodanobacter sp.]
MQEGPQAKTWLHHIVIAVVYGVGVTLLRQVVVPHWVLLTGVHLCVLLLMRYRDWPALIVGEAVSLAPLSLSCADQWGWPWAITNIIPALVVMAPVVYWARERWHLFPTPKTLNMEGLLSLSLIVSLLMTAYNLFTMSITQLPPGYVVHYDKLAAQWMLGNYLGILTVAPTVLFARQLLPSLRWRELGTRFSENREVIESMCLVLPALLMMIWLGLSAPHLRQIAQVAMFLPVVWLAMRHGWQGAALGGTVSSFAVVALMPALYDHDTMQAQAVIAFVISSMLLLGAHIAVLNHRAEQERLDVRSTLALAQRNVHMGEMHLRMTSVALDQIRETVQAGYQMLATRLRDLHPAADQRTFQRQALIAQDLLYRLSDTLYPLAWRERGFSAALREGSIPRVLDEAGVIFRCNLRGPLSRLSTHLHLAIYRMVVEAIADACLRKNASDVDLRMRCGEKQGQMWAVVALTFRTNEERLARVKWGELIPRITRSASGLGWPAIKDRATTFGGQANERVMSSRRRITLVLFDQEKLSGDVHR